MNSLSSCYDQFILNYYLNKNEIILSQLHYLLRTAEARMKGKCVASSPIAAYVLAISQGKKRKGPPKLNWKGKSRAWSSSSGPKGKSISDAPPVSDPKEATCFYFNDKGHWKRSFLKYLQDIKDGKVKQPRQVFTLSYLKTQHILILGSLIQDVVFIFVLICRG